MYKIFVREMTDSSYKKLGGTGTDANAESLTDRGRANFETRMANCLSASLVRPVRLLRVWVSEGLTQADS